MKRAKESNLRFNLRRFSAFLRALLGNRMAATGLAMLIISTTAALIAPVAFPKNPQQVTSAGDTAQPEWVTNFPEGYYLSKNMAVANDPTFSSASALQEWSYRYDPARGSYLSIAWSSFSPTAPPSGSIHVSSSSSSSVNLLISKTFYYPYRGAPARFQLPPISVHADGISSQQVQLRYYITRGTEQNFTFWSANLTKSNSQTKPWTSPDYTLDSATPDLQAEMGAQGALLTLPAIIFSRVDNYTMNIALTLPAGASIYLTNLGMIALGTAFGLLGTDANGGDLFAELLYGARISLFVGLIAAFIGIGLGLVVGLIAGYKTGLVDEVLMRFTDMMLVLPGLPLLLVLITVLGPNLLNIIIIIGFLGWMGFARVIRSQVLALKERPFMEAARAAGAGTGRILKSHVFPNVVSLTYVNLALAVPTAILTEAALSFLGLGDPTAISWGQIVGNAENTNNLRTWWWVIPPGAAIAFVSLSFVLIGYALDEMFNPKLRKRR